MEQRPLISVSGLSKKFSKDIKYNMYYGILDLLYGMVGTTVAYDQLRKREFWALENVDLELSEGEILGVVGSNGSGKTTLMRLISGIYPVNAGKVMGREGQKITAIFALGSGMQSLFTGRENIYIKGAMYGMTKREIDAQMDFIEEFSELGDRLDRPFGNYSSGMKARLSYSIAMATQPDVFIIDESLAVGDSAFKAKCIDNLKVYAQQPGKGIIFVSNQIRKVMKVATRVIVMDSGKIVHNSTDVKSALEFYIMNAYRDLEPDKQRNKFRKIQDYEM